MSKRVLVLGAGLVTRPLVRYLLDSPGFEVTVATRTVSKAVAMVDGHRDGKAISLNVDDAAALGALVDECDLAISLVPWTHHMKVAQACLDRSKHLVTTSYVKEPMAALDEQVRAKGLLFLNECGLDPGIDHMSAMRIIHDVQGKGGKVTEFLSCCGGLPAPASNDNPWGYKFSWSPRGVVLAGRNPAKYIKDGREVDVPGPELFSDVVPHSVESVGELEIYPNRDSLGYLELYGLQGARTLFRGTFRYPGHCRTWKGLADMGWLDLEERDVAGMTYGQLTASLIGSAGKDVHAEVAERLGVDPSDDCIERMAWLGLLGDDAIGISEPTSPLDVLSPRLEQKLPYLVGEKDMIVLQHRFLAQYDDRKERITSTLVDYGVFGEDTSMARTVSLPAAMAARLLLEGRIKETGVHIPTVSAIYDPILEELATLGISFEETSEPA